MYRRVFIFELSGPTLSFLQQRLDHLPTFKRLFEHGASAPLEGPPQPVLAPSFAALYTGMNPGQTGLFDFFSFPTGGYQRIPYSLRLLAQKTMFEHLSECGKRVGMLNTPLLHPLPEVDGFLVSGDDSIGDDFARPVELGRTLMERGYSVPFGDSYAPSRERTFHERCLAVLEMRRDAARLLFREQVWDFGMLTLHLYGELLHAFWRFYDPRHPEYRRLAEVFGKADPFLEALVEIDALLAEMIEAAGSRALIIVMGAWGHRLEHTTVHLNRLLEREGYLRFKRGLASQLKHGLFRLGMTVDRAEQLAHRLNIWKRVHYAIPRGRRASLTDATFLSFDDVDWSRTRAVALGYLGQIYLNVRGERPAGVVAPQERQRERQRLGAALQALRDPRTGEPVVERVWSREEIYRGAKVSEAPDLIVQWHEGYTGNSRIGSGRRIVAPSPVNHSSDHCIESFLLMLGDGVRPGRIEARLEDIAPTVMQALGVPGLPGCDGRPLPVLG
jgi:predicted AlkP superfamily phosphohydrolase/phosphomutase